jgi:hypothetical protein
MFSLQHLFQRAGEVRPYCFGVLSEPSGKQCKCICDLASTMASRAIRTLYRLCLRQAIDLERQGLVLDFRKPIDKQVGASNAFSSKGMVSSRTCT